MPIKLKKEYENEVVGFNNSSLPLGQRKDLHVLLGDVIGPGDQIRDTHIAGMFETLPTRDELDQLANEKLSKKAEQVKTSLASKAASGKDIV